MKIVGFKGARYVVEATEDELAIAAGFPNAMATGWQKVRPSLGQFGRLCHGAQIPVSDASVYHVRIHEIRHALLRIARNMRSGELEGVARAIEDALADPNIHDITDLDLPMAGQFAREE